MRFWSWLGDVLFRAQAAQGTAAPAARIVDHRVPEAIHEIESALSAFRATIDDPDFLLEKDPLAYQKLRREPRIQQAIRHRCSRVAGLSWQIVPASQGEADRKCAVLVDQLFRGIHGFMAARASLAMSCLSGLAIARIFGAWQKRDLAGTGLRRWWVPSRLGPISKQRVRAVTGADGEVSWEIRDVARQEWLPLTRPDEYVWHRYADDEDGLGRGLGLGEPLWVLWRSKTLLIQYALTHAERWAHGVVEVSLDRTVPGTAERTLSQLVEDWLALLPKQMSRHGLVHDMADQVKLLESDCSGADYVLQLIRYHDDTAVSLILNSNLPTSVSSGGSYALADVQADSLEATILYDRGLLEETLTRDLLGLVWRLNLPTMVALGLRPTGMPTFAITARLRKDVSVLQAAMAAGLPLVRSEVYELLEFTPPTEGDDVLQPPQAVAAFSAAAGSALPAPGAAVPVVAEEPVPTLAPEAAAGKLLTVAEAADQLRVGPGTVRRWVVLGQIRGGRLGGVGPIRIPEGAVRELVGAFEAQEEVAEEAVDDGA